MGEEMTGRVGRMDGMGGQLTFCERVTATPTSPNHIRRVGDEGLKFGGGAPDTTLCGKPLNKGWDLPALRDVTVELWRTWPNLLTAWLERLTDDLNRWTGKHR